MTKQISTAKVATDRAARYGKQLASHFSRKLETTWDAQTGTGFLRFVGSGKNSGERLPFDGIVTCSMQAASDALILKVEAESENIEQLEKVVGGHLVRFGKNDGLTVSWEREDGSAGSYQRFSEDDAHRHRDRGAETGEKN